MRRCTEVLSLLADYLEQRLPADVHARLEQHLNGCSTCITYLKTYRSTLQLLGSLRDADLPPELRTRLQAFLDARSKN
jgi:putative zinc finger protein